jgi:hypothetical protein
MEKIHTLFPGWRIATFTTRTSGCALQALLNTLTQPYIFLLNLFAIGEASRYKLRIVH